MMVLPLSLCGPWQGVPVDDGRLASLLGGRPGPDQVLRLPVLAQLVDLLQQPQAPSCASSLMALPRAAAERLPRLQEQCCPCSPVLKRRHMVQV